MDSTGYWEAHTAIFKLVTNKIIKLEINFYLTKYTNTDQKDLVSKKKNKRSCI
jgi:hypothetical protein